MDDLQISAGLKRHAITANDIPEDVINAAQLVSDWCKANGSLYWRMANIASREQLEHYERLLLRLGITHLVGGPGGGMDAQITVFNLDGTEVLGETMIKADEARWFVPLVRHDGSEVKIRAIVGEPGSRRMMHVTATCMPIGG